MKAKSQENNLVAEKVLTGRFTGMYRFYDKEKPQTTLAHCQPIHLTEMLDSVILSDLNGKKWDTCDVIEPSGNYTIYFDTEYKKELCKDLLAKLVAINTGTNIYAAEDVISYTEDRCAECGTDLNAICETLSDFLGLDSSYAWIFS